MDTLKLAVQWLADAYAVFDSWRWSLGGVLFCGLAVLIFMVGSPKTNWLVPKWVKNWLNRVIDGGAEYERSSDKHWGH